MPTGESWQLAQVRWQAQLRWQKMQEAGVRLAGTPGLLPPALLSAFPGPPQAVASGYVDLAWTCKISVCLRTLAGHEIVRTAGRSGIVCL